MRCHDFVERISAYLDGELGGDTRAAMDAHAGQCAACERKLVETRAVTERLRRLPRARPSAGFDFAVRSQLLMEVSREGRLAARLEAFFRPAFPRFALAGAVAALVLLGAASVLMEEEKLPVAPPVAQVVRTPLPVADAGPVTQRGALKLRDLSAESYPVSGRYYRERQDSLRAAARRLPAATRSSNLRTVTVRF